MCGARNPPHLPQVLLDLMLHKAATAIHKPIALRSVVLCAFSSWIPQVLPAQPEASNTLGVCGRDAMWL